MAIKDSADEISALPPGIYQLPRGIILSEPDLYSPTPRTADDVNPPDSPAVIPKERDKEGSDAK